MGKLLFASLLYMGLASAACNKHTNQHVEGSQAVEKQVNDSLKSHRAPNQTEIDSIKAAKTRKKQNRDKNK
ncbi:MAG: hypothetical protein AAF696_15625 [Bacteroidota bacterium]